MNRNSPLLLALAIGLFAGVLVAYDGDPADTWHRRVPYSGQLRLAGVAVEDPVDIDFDLYWTESGGSPLWSETQNIDPSAGRFSTVLGDDDQNPIPQSAFAARDSLYLAMTVDGTPIGRQRLLGAPFASGAASVPPGAIMAFAGEAPRIPDGWLLCDGSAVLRADYPALFDAISTYHGQGDGSSTFNLPDYRGRFLRGVSGGTGRDPNAGARSAMNTGGRTGDLVGSVQGDATSLPNSAWTTSNPGDHNHNNGNYKRLMIIGSDSGVSTRSFSGGDNSPGEPDLALSANIVASGSHTHTVGGGDLETRPQNANVNYIIKF
jgi:microcystin-dependent protein